MSDGGRPLPQSKASKDGKATKAVSQHKRTRYWMLDARCWMSDPLSQRVGPGGWIQYPVSSIQYPDLKGEFDG